MNPFKKLALTFTAALALFAGDAMAQCSGKKVYIELPSTWGSNLYIEWDGTFVRLNTTNEGNFRVFTFSGLSNDNAGGASNAKIIFMNKNVYSDQTGMMFLTKASATAGTISTANSHPSTGKFSCNDFKSTTYISLVPNSSTQVTISSDPPNTRYFYFLPPNDPDWILNTPILLEGSKTTKLEVAPGKCGWYRRVYFTDKPTDDPAIIVQTLKDASSPTSQNKIGDKGMDEEPSEWINGAPTPIKLKTRFDEAYGDGKGGELYLVAAGNNIGWTKADPGIDEKNRCTYDFAAIIYDTDMQVNKSFTSLQDDIGCGSDQYSKWTSGIVKGMVKPTLNTTTRKIECDKCARGGTVASSQGYFLTEQDFKNAFDPNSNTNVVVCYDMPFARSADGLWEFDSDKMVNDQNKPVGGFFPKILQNPATSGGNYSSCASCGSKSPAESFVNLTDSINPWCFERGFKTTNKSGQTMSSCGGAYGPASGTGCPSSRGDFSHGENPAQTWGAAPKGGADWTETWRFDQINMWNGFGSGGVGKNATANQLFCFESHAEFTYEPGQEFFFRGDDDIWVYMNNQLVVDLGGTHLAAPGYVNLRDQASKLGLTEGNKYPIDIFFCDRRTGMSNVRIKTNMYFSQTQPQLSLKTGNAEIKGDVCLETSGGGGSCADITGGGGEKVKCGTQIMTNLRYYLRNRAGTSGEDLAGIGVPGQKGIILDSKNENCESAVDGDNQSYLRCYGGIRIYTTKGQVQVLTEDIPAILAGTWYVYVTLNDEPRPAPLKIAEFSKNVRVQVVWGEIRTEDGNKMADLHPTNSASVIAGKTVPIGFAAPSEQPGENEFRILMDPRDGSPGKNVTVSVSGGGNRGKLTFCKDEVCSEVLDGTTFTIPNLGQDSEGLLVLWAKGNFEAEDDMEYIIKAQGHSAEFKLKVYQPRMRFVKPGTTEIDEDRMYSDPTKPGGPADKWVWLGTEMIREIVAFDPSQGSLKPCGTLCDGIELRYKAWADIDRAEDRRLIDINGLIMENGVAKLSMAGMTPIPEIYGGDDWASVKIMGPSALEETATEWTKMQFRKPPIPVPDIVELYDRYGGGRGDSLIIIYDRPFGTKEADGVYDYPTYIEVIWDETRTDTIGYGTQFRREGSQYVFSGSTSAVKEFWKKCDTEGGRRVEQCLINDSTIVIVRGDYDNSFSGERIKTGGDGKVVSWATFDNPDRPGTPLTTGSGKTIDEKIPPIVIGATYFKGNAENCGDSRTNFCSDNVRIDLSEPVKLAEGVSEDAVRTAFAYILRSMNRAETFEASKGPDDLPARVSWAKSGGIKPDSDRRDSSTTFTFRAFKGQSDTAFTPIAGDSIRFLAGRKSPGSPLVFLDAANPEAHPLVDLKGNHPHPHEWGRLIMGEKRSGQEKNLIAGTRGTDEDDVKRKEDLDRLYGGSRITETLFPKDKPIELLAVPENWTAKSCSLTDDECVSHSVKYQLPGTVGVIFEQDFGMGIENFKKDNEKKLGGKSVGPENITLYAKSFYHTNLGNYVVNSDLIELKCTDPIFKYGGATNCTESGWGGQNSKLYLAWNFKDAKGRWAGAGAYVQVYEFWWEINVGDVKSGKKDHYNKIEMYGVKRLKKSSGGN